MEIIPNADRSREFLDWLDRWHADLPAASLREVLEAAGGAGHVGVMAVDLLVGFCTEGVLASPRVGALAPRAAAFLQGAWDAGIRHMVKAMDAHPADSPEFSAFPPHCVAGTREAEVIPELRALPFFDQVRQLPKTSLSIGLAEGMGEWAAERPDLRAWIILGDCTDLCVYQAAMHLKLQANARGRRLEVWVPASLVDTYDLPVAAAQAAGALPHDGDLLHRLFLYHMALNGIRVVRDLTP